MLRFKQTERISAYQALKSQYFADCVDAGQTTDETSANDSSLSSETEHDSDD